MAAIDTVQTREKRRPAKTPFSIFVDEESRPPVVRLTGDVDVAVADKLGEQLFRLVEAGFSQLTIDCADVTYFDSTGLSKLVSASRMAEMQKLKLVNCGPRLVKLLNVTGLDNVFDVVVAGGE